jgi:hypothetical protein
MNNNAELIFMKWKADLADMDRSSAAMEGNFDILFFNLSRSRVSMEAALPYLDRAIKAHSPSEYVLKSVFKQMKKNGNTSNSLQEFETSWKEHIASAAKRVFFSIYTLEEAETKTTKYGNMSASEYRKQQKYADSHPTLDWEALIKEQEQEAEADSKSPDVDPGKVNLDINLGDL